MKVYYPYIPYVKLSLKEDCNKKEIIANKIATLSCANNYNQPLRVRSDVKNKDTLYVYFRGTSRLIEKRQGITLKRGCFFFDYHRKKVLARLCVDAKFDKEDAFVSKRLGCSCYKNKYAPFFSDFYTAYEENREHKQLKEDEIKNPQIVEEKKILLKKKSLIAPQAKNKVSLETFSISNAIGKNNTPLENIRNLIDTLPSITLDGQSFSLHATDDKTFAICYKENSKKQKLSSQHNKDV